jgi:hypothetical protein
VSKSKKFNNKSKKFEKSITFLGENLFFSSFSGKLFFQFFIFLFFNEQIYQECDLYGTENIPYLCGWKVRRKWRIQIEFPSSIH